LKDNFETDLSKWTTGGTGTMWGRSLDALGYYASDSPGANYQPNSDSWMATASATSLVDQQNCLLTYSFNLESEKDGDLLQIDASTNGTTWSKVGGWTGSTGGDWLTGTHDLSAFDGGPVYVRFRMISNALLNYAGASVDDVEIRCLGINFTGTEFSYYSGTSMATPQVSGVAALLLSVSPDSNIASLKAALLSGTDSISALTGKSVTGGRLNATKALKILVPDVGTTANPTPTPSESATTEPSPSPTPTEPVETPVLEHARSVSLGLSGHLRVQGTVTAADGFLACAAQVPVRITRNGVVIKEVMTDANGSYTTRVRDRRGRYKARLPRVELPGQLCLGDSSPAKRHRL
jgi:hypothetical protein